MAFATSDSAFELPPADGRVSAQTAARCSAQGVQMAAAGRCVKVTMSALATCLNIACSMVVRARREVADTPATLRQDAWVQLLALACVVVHHACIMHHQQRALPQPRNIISATRLHGIQQMYQKLMCVLLSAALELLPDQLHLHQRLELKHQGTRPQK